MLWFHHEGKGAVRRATSAAAFARRSVAGRKSPGDEAESASLKRQDLPEPSPHGVVATEQLAIATVMWPVGRQPTNSTGLTLALTPSPFPRTFVRSYLSLKQPASSNKSLRLVRSGTLVGTTHVDG